MYNNFENNLEVLLNETQAEALTKLKKHDPEYADIIRHYANLNDSLRTFCNSKDKKIGSKYKDMMAKLLESSEDKDRLERPALYLQGFCDCIKILNQFGLIS
ncbi:MAG: hypothetical protein RSA27_03565 [Oscillospiraceae bacterium]